MPFSLDRREKSGNLIGNRRRFRAGVERVEARELLAAMAAVPPVVVNLAAYSDSGVSHTDGITNVSRPTFTGTGANFAMVQVEATRAGSWPTQMRYLGSTIVNDAGNWSLVSPYLPDGSWTVTATITAPHGSPSVPVAMDKPLVIDTIAPRVTGVAISSRNDAIVAVISDVGSGLLTSTANDPDNYTVVPPGTIVGAHPANGMGPRSNPSISGFYSNGNAYTVRIGLGASTLPGGKTYTFQIRSGGITDVAGNALDGEFSGRLPSGNGAPGGNFIARLTTNQLPTSRATAAHLRRRR